MVHLSWPLRAYMSGDGYLSGGVAAGLLHLLGAREIPENRARLPLRPVLRSPPARRPIASRLTFRPRGPCPFPRSPLLGLWSLPDSHAPPARPLPLLLGPRCLASARSSAPRPRLLASVRICARNLVSSLSLKPHVDFLGVCVKKASFSKERRREAVFSFALTARHFSPRSRTLGCVVFLLAPRAPMCKRSSQ